MKGSIVVEKVQPNIFSCKLYRGKELVACKGVTTPFDSEQAGLIKTSNWIKNQLKVQGYPVKGGVAKRFALPVTYSFKTNGGD